MKRHQGYCYGLMRKTGEAETILRELVTARSAGKVVPPHAIALAYLGLGQIDPAFEWLERAVDEYDTWSLLLLSVDPWFDHLRDHQRAKALLTRVRLA